MEQKLPKILLVPVVSGIIIYNVGLRVDNLSNAWALLVALVITVSIFGTAIWRELKKRK